MRSLEPGLRGPAGGLALLLGCGVSLSACSPAPDFGDEPSATASSGSSGDTSSVGAGGGGGDDVTAGGGDPGGAGPGGGDVTSTSSSSSGGGPACEVAEDCPEPDGPCQIAVCEVGGVCGVAPRPAGADGGACGVCQGGLHVGTCGYRLYSRPFPTAGDDIWTSVPLSDVLDSVDAPPPAAIAEVEAMHSVDRLFVWSDDGMLYERYQGTWQPPVPIATRFPSYPEGARVALAVIWRPTAESADESVLLTTDEPEPRSVTYTLSDGGAAVALVAGPSPIEPSDDPNGPAQDVDPWAWGFAEQRGYLGSTDDWVVFWGAVGDTLYQYWGGNDEFQPPTPLAGVPLSMDGASGAPDGLTVDAGWRADGKVYVLAP